jgi:hypothetical protein
MADISEYLDKAYEQEEFSELAELPIDALQGVSKADAEAIQEAFGVKTIRQLAEHKFIRAAQGITLLAGAKRRGSRSSGAKRQQRRKDGEGGGIATAVKKMISGD